MILQPFPALLLIPCDLPVQAFHIRKLSFVTQKMQQLHPAGLFVQITGKIQQKCSAAGAWASATVGFTPTSVMESKLPWGVCVRET